MFVRIKVLYPKININLLDTYYKRKSISAHIVPKFQKHSNYTYVELENKIGLINKKSTNNTYCSCNEEKKVDDFKVFYEKLYEKYNNEKNKSVNEKKNNQNFENEFLKNNNTNENKDADIKKKITNARMKKYKVIAQNEKIPLSSYLNDNSESKKLLKEIKENKKQSPKNPVRIRKFKILYNN